MKMKKDKIDKYEEENRKYWMQRALQQEQDAHLVSERYLSKVGNQLASYRQDLISEIETFYARYAKDHKMSHAEAKRYLRDNEMKEFQGVTLEKFRAMALNPDTPTPLLDALAYRHRISRKEALLAEIERKTAELYGGKNGIADNVTNNLSEVYIKGKIQQMKNLADFGIVENPILNLKAVQNKLATNWSGQEFSERIWGQSQRTFNSIQKVIDQGLTGGWSVDRMSKELTLRTGVALSQARTLVQTETTFYNNLATLDTIKELGAEYYEIVAVLDNNTSKICRRKNGKIYPVSKYKAGQTAPPFHVWCRSTIMPSHQSKDGEKSDNPYIDILMNDHKVNVAPNDKSLSDVFDEWEREGEAIKEKLIARNKEKVYNQGMNSIDLMAKQRSFVVGDDIRVNAKKLSGTEFDFWAQDTSKEIRDTIANVQEAFRQLPDYSKPTVVFLKKSRLPGLAGYDNKQDILFISDALSSEKEFKDILSDGFFASKNIKDAIIHELTHKKHWDSAKAFYNTNKKRYNSVEQAMTVLNSELVTYVKQQQSTDRSYLKNISLNAYNAFLYYNNINELVAEVGVIGEDVSDNVLLQKVKEVLKWK